MENRLMGARFYSAVLFVVALLALPVVFAISAQSDGGEVSLLVRTNDLAGHWYNESGLAGYRMRWVLGQRFIGFGNSTLHDFRIKLGYIAMLNSDPRIEALAINANKTFTKHPYTNDTLPCEMNLTDKDVGDRLKISVKWYRNSTNWYFDNSINTLHTGIDYSNISSLVSAYSLGFEEWTGNKETIYHTLLSSQYYSTNTSPFYTPEQYDFRTLGGSLNPSETKHFDIWVCSVDVFDGTSHSGWTNSSPMFIFNHRPDFDDSMPTYYEIDEDSDLTIPVGSYFSDIDFDDINWYINWTSPSGIGRFTIQNITVVIDNSSGDVYFKPNSNVTGIMDLVITGVDYNPSHSPFWYLFNDYSHTNTSVFRINITQINDAPWPSGVYIYSANPSYQDDLICQYIYNDIENHPEDLSALSFRWWLQDEGVGPWVNLGLNQSTISPTGIFDLDDKIICSVRVKDTYVDHLSVNRSLFSQYVNSSIVTVVLEEQRPSGEGEIIIGVG